MSNYKFDWASVTGGEAIDPIDKYLALYAYACEHYTGQWDWRYALQCKLSKIVKPGPLYYNILSGHSEVANEYYNHLVAMFENNYKAVGSMMTFCYSEPEYHWDIIVTGIVGEFSSLEELTRDVYSEIIGQCHEHYPSIVDIYQLLEFENITFPLSIPEKEDHDDDDGSEYTYGLNFCFDFEEGPNEAEGDIF